MAFFLMILKQMSPVKPHIRIPFKRYEKPLSQVNAEESAEEPESLERPVYADITLNPSAVITGVKKGPLARLSKPSQPNDINNKTE